MKIPNHVDCKFLNFKLSYLQAMGESVVLYIKKEPPTTIQDYKDFLNILLLAIDITDDSHRLILRATKFTDPNAQGVADLVLDRFDYGTKEYGCDTTSQDAEQQGFGTTTAYPRGH